MTFSPFVNYYILEKEINLSYVNFKHNVKHNLVFFFFFEFILTNIKRLKLRNVT